MKSDYRTAYDNTDYALANMSGLLDALQELAMEHPVLGKLEERAIMSMINVLRDQSTAVHSLHEAEWKAARDQELLESGKPVHQKQEQ